MPHEFDDEDIKELEYASDMSDLEVTKIEFGFHFIELIPDGRWWFRVREFVNNNGKPRALYKFDLQNKKHIFYFVSNDDYVKFCQTFPEIFKASEEPI